MKKDLIIGLTSGFVVGIGVGGGAVYAWLNKKYAQAFNEAIDAVSDEVRRDYARFYADWQPKPTLEDSLPERADTVEDEPGTAASRLVERAKAERDEIINEEFYNGTPEDPEEAEVIETRNIFDDELASRIEFLSIEDPSKPYLITMEQFMDPYENHGKLSLTWFEEDDIIIEEGSENIIDNTELIGSEVLAAFGHDPRDKDMIHVRNEVFEADLEVTRDRRSYAEVIAGYVVPAEESPHKKPRREDDDR